MGALYRLDFPNGKSYVGITTLDVNDRFAEHVACSSKSRKWAVHKAIAKYGADSVRVVTLAIADSWEYLCLIERKAIEVFGTFGKAGYNLTSGGEGIVGYSHSEEARKKMSASHRGVRRSDAHRENIRKALLGNKYPLGKKQPPQTIQRRRMAQYAVATGVTWDSRTNKWRACISVNGKQHSLGRHVRREDALSARHDAVAKLLAGEPI